MIFRRCGWQVSNRGWASCPTKTRKKLPLVHPSLPQIAIDVAATRALCDGTDGAHPDCFAFAPDCPRRDARMLQKL
jgi:hypothetical protein